MQDNFKHTELTDKIIKAFYKVYNQLGYGFLEKVYVNALRYELGLELMAVEKGKPINVYYREFNVGEYFADLVVNDVVILEIKSIEELHVAQENQLLNYLKATNIEVGLLLNFGKKPQVKRKVYSNELKNFSKQEKN